jgi:putative membrane protein insertion efficiency factor
VKHVMILLIRIYQRLLSPWLPASCIYSPSCSCFAHEAYSRHGFWRGTQLALTRVLRCWPWSAGGYDPVP